MQEKVRYTHDRLVDEIVDNSNCDTLKERKELRQKLRGKSYHELIGKFRKLTARPR